MNDWFANKYDGFFKTITDMIHNLLWLATGAFLYAVIERVLYWIFEPEK